MAHELDYVSASARPPIPTTINALSFVGFFGLLPLASMFSGLRFNPSGLKLEAGFYQYLGVALALLFIVLNGWCLLLVLRRRYRFGWTVIVSVIIQFMLIFYELYLAFSTFSFY